VLSYVDRGAGPSVLLVHGSNSDLRIWADHGQIIARGTVSSRWPSVISDSPPGSMTVGTFRCKPTPTT